MNNTEVKEIRNFINFIRGLPLNVDSSTKLAIKSKIDDLESLLKQFIERPSKCLCGTSLDPVRDAYHGHFFMENDRSYVCDVTTHDAILGDMWFCPACNKLALFEPNSNEAQWYEPLSNFS